MPSRSAAPAPDERPPLESLPPGRQRRSAGSHPRRLLAALALTFAPGLALPDEGTTLALLDFAAFDGAFDPARVRISGIDTQRVDLSRLGVDGTVAITPVPEPGTVGMMLAGLEVVGWRGRRGHVRQGMEALALDHDGHGP